MKRVFIAFLNVLGIYRIAHAFYERAQYAFAFRLRKKNRKWIKKGAPDGLPVPPPRLVNLVAGHFDVAVFYQNGRLGADCIRAILAKNGIEMDQFLSFLDFGCGCGRIVRFWQKLQGPEIHGSDYNRDLVRWCRDHLPFGRFKINKPHPPLDYEDEQFGFVYAISVFTHLAEEWQVPWMEEIHRVCRPGGFVLITVHGESHLHQLPSEEREKFQAGKLAAIREKYSGTNICGVFHPESYVRNVLANGFFVIDFLPLGAKDANQDMYLLQKPLLS
jgi:SAM-dependent methyltransferase